MTKSFITLTVLLISTLFLSCTSPTNTNTAGNQVLSGKTTEETSSQIFGINGEGVPIREAPGENSKKVINEKATQALGKTEYCEVDYSVKVEVLETSGNWTKIKVVEPEWLSASHVGWILSRYLVSKEKEEQQSLKKLDTKEYEIMKTRHKQTVENFYVLLKHPNFDKHYVHYFVKEFRKEHCTMNCNVFVYDSRLVLPLVDIYPLGNKDYIKLADHFISMSTFDATEVRDWYPYQDFKYKEYGGKNWKKDPIN